MKIRTLPEHLRTRFTEEERTMYEAGQCGWQLAYGGVGLGEPYCLAPFDPASEMGFCTEHETDLRKQSGGAPITTTLQGVYGGPPETWWLDCNTCAGRIYAGEMAWVTEAGDVYLGAAHETCPEAPDGG